MAEHPTDALARLRMEMLTRRRELAEAVSILMEMGPYVGVSLTGYQELAPKTESWNGADLNIHVSDPHMLRLMADAVKAERSKQLMDATEDPST